MSKKDPHPILKPGRIVQLLLFVLVIPLLPLLITRRWGWWEAWVYALISILGFLISRFLASRKHPDLLAERARFSEHEDPAEWDRVLAPVVALGSGLIPLAAGLDELFGWSGEFPAGLQWTALTLFLAGYLLGAWALITNRYFSSLVRIQHDRGHQVVTGGPYRWVRHPGYAGAFLSYLAAPVLLDSFWALTPSAFLLITLVIRTALEDRTLHEELEGYQRYSEEVRSRLIPGVW